EFALRTCIGCRLTAPPPPDDAPGATLLRCGDCGASYPASDVRSSCSCGGLLDVEHDLGADGSTLRRLFADRRAAPGLGASGVWRYRELVMSAEPDEIVSFPEGDTPLLERPSVTRWAGADTLLLKHEGM